jgi:sugar/nucleoside kinase (ribokinase family)
VLGPGPLVDQIPDGTLRAVLERVDWVSCNEREAQLLTGQRDAFRAAEQLGAGRSGVVVRLGVDGCLVGGRGGVLPVAGFPVEVVDTTGAGDTHVGAFLAGLAAGLDPVRAARRANACAAVSVTRAGPATSGTPAEVEQLLSG